jgi:putative ABC transport system ATP-binding protein
LSEGVDLKIKKGEFVCIYGMSGGGKTSLLNIIGTIDRPTKGDVTICGTRITNSTDDNVYKYNKIILHKIDLTIKYLGTCEY